MVDTEKKGKVRVLCIHGFGQTALSFRKKTGSVRKAAKKVAEFEFLDAPHIVPGTEGCERAWYLPCALPAIGERFVFEDDSEKLSWDGGVDEATVNTSVAHVKSACDEASKPYDGILGFSQGAALIPHIIRKHLGCSNLRSSFLDLNLLLDCQMIIMASSVHRSTALVFMTKLSTRNDPLYWRLSLPMLK